MHRISDRGIDSCFFRFPDWTALTVALEIALDHADHDASKVAISLRLAEVFSEKLNFDSAIEVLEAAKEVSPKELSVSTQLQKAYLKTQSGLIMLSLANCCESRRRANIYCEANRPK